MLQQVARALLYCTPLVLVVVMPSTFFPFIGIKYYLFRTLVTLAGIAAVLGWAFEWSPRSLKAQFLPVLRSPAGIGFMLLTAAILFASAFAYDPVAAFWSNYERGEGAFQFLHYFIFFVLAAGLFTQREHWKAIMKFSIVGSIGVALYGLFAALDPDAFVGIYGAYEGKNFWQLLVVDRFQGSLGNAAYVTGYFIFIIGYVLWLWSGAQSKLRSAILAVPMLAFSGVFFLLSGTRGAFIGLLAGAGVAAIYYAWREPKYRRWIIGAIAIGVLAFSGLLAMRNHPVVTAIPGSRLLQIDLGQLTAQTRLWTWQSAWKGFQDRPLLGWGPENFTPVFDKYFDARHFVPGQNSETWFDRAHNIVLEYLVTTGIIGLAAWITFVVLVFVQVGRALKTKVLNGMQEAVLVGLPVAYVVQSLLLFDVLPIFMNLALVAALAVAVTRWKPKDALDHAREH
jgi:O-antigen ligase